MGHASACDLYSSYLCHFREVDMEVGFYILSGAVFLGITVILLLQFGSREENFFELE